MQNISLETFITALAYRSGEKIMPYFRKSPTVADKSVKGVAFDPVTEADRAAEAVIRQMIQETFPHHGIYGEEFGLENASAEHVWVIDPIDGTRAFICGLPVWGTLIGLTYRADAILGVMHQPFTGELFIGNGKTASLKRGDQTVPLKTRPCADLSDAYLMTTAPELYQDTAQDAFLRVQKEIKLTRYGVDCYAFAMLAAGQVDLVIESGLKPYDIMGLIPVIEGAGGVITNWTGGAAEKAGNIIASGDARLHDKALKRLSHP